MTYQEFRQIAESGKLGKLPNFRGYFKWSYNLNDLVFYNEDFLCLADDLKILHRTDFYYII